MLFHVCDKGIKHLVKPKSVHAVHSEMRHCVALFAQNVSVMC